MSNTYQIYLISDSTGETLDRIFLSLKAQFKNIDYKVDGLSGATLTSRGVTNMLAYWFGESGYKQVLENLKNG